MWTNTWGHGHLRTVVSFGEDNALDAIQTCVEQSMSGWTRRKSGESPVVAVTLELLVQPGLFPGTAAERATACLPSGSKVFINWRIEHRDGVYSERVGADSSEDDECEPPPSLARTEWARALISMALSEPLAVSGVPSLVARVLGVLRAVGSLLAVRTFLQRSVSALAVVFWESSCYLRAGEGPRGVLISERVSEGDTAPAARLLRSYSVP